MIKNYVIALLAVLGLMVACTSDNDSNQSDASGQNRVDGQKIVDDDTMTPEQKAQKLVEAGEMLFSPESFFLADRLFVEAMNHDSSNKKAQMYRAITKPMMNLKGIVKRIEPLMKKDPKSYESYQANYYGEQAGIRMHPLLDEFLKDGEPDIATEKDLQDFLQGQVAAYDEARTFFRENRDLELEINVSEKWFDQRLKDRGHICTYTRIHDLATDIDCEINMDFMKMKVDRGEMEVFKNSFAGMQIYSILLTAYDGTGLQKTIMETRDEPLMTQQQKIEIAKNSDEKLGTLRDDQALSQIVDLGIDAMVGVRWIQENQETLCPLPTEGTSFVYTGEVEITSRVDGNGNYHYDYRPGKELLRREGYVLDEGLCLNEGTFHSPLEKVLDTIDLALSGGVIEVEGEKKRQTFIQMGRSNIPVIRSTGEKVKAEIRPTAVLNNPIQNLRSVAPDAYNDCGEAKSFADNSLGGLFVNGDADQFLSETKAINKNEGLCAVEY